MSTAIDETLQKATTNQGQSLLALSHEAPTLVVLLRHGGCPFCRETLAKLSGRRAEIESGGNRIVLIHMMPDEHAARLFARYGLDDVQRISDPEQSLYQAFGLKRGTAGQVMGPGIWWHGFKTTLLAGHLPSRPVGDIFQLPGAFVLDRGEVVRSFQPENSAEQTDYAALACNLSPVENES